MWVRIVTSRHPQQTLSSMTWDLGKQGAFATSLAEDARGRIFVGTEGSGVWMYNPRHAQWRQWTAQKSGLADDNIYALAVDKKGRVWAGTLRNGVSVYNGLRWRNYDVLNGPLGERVFDIAVCPTDGDVWIATNAGLARYSDQKDTWKYYTRADGLPSDQAQALGFDAKGNVYVATQCDGLAMSDAANEYSKWRVAGSSNVADVANANRLPTSRGLPSNLLNDVLVSQSNVVYVATNSGLAWSKDNGKTWSYRRGRDWEDKVRNRLIKPASQLSKDKDSPTLSEDYVTSLAQNGAGDLWIGHRQTGYEVLYEKTLKPKVQVLTDVVSPEVPNALRDYVMHILPTNSGAAYLAYYGGGVTQSSPRSAAKQEIVPVDVPAPLPDFPSPTKAPTVQELNTLAKKINSQQTPLKEGEAAFLQEDWTTQGDWVGRYGRQHTILCATVLPGHEFTQNYNYVAVGKIGPKYESDSLRNWIQLLQSDDPRVLYNPALGYRREAEWDDHGEAYDMKREGPDVWVTIRVPPGIHRVSLYFFNKDGHDGDNRFRDYLAEVRPWTVKLEDALKLPVLAQTRVRDFWGGYYKNFIVRGPKPAPVPEGFLTEPVTRYYIRVSRNHSFNTILQSVLIDKLRVDTGKATLNVEDQSALPSIGKVAYHPPFVENTKLKVQEVNNKRLEVAATDLWTSLNKSYAMEGSQTLQREGRLLSYRALASVTGDDKSGLQPLLDNWRWKLFLWSPQERVQFSDTMKRAWKASQDYPTFVQNKLFVKEGDNLIIKSGPSPLKEWPPKGAKEAPR